MDTEHRLHLDSLTGISAAVEDSIVTDLAFCHPAIAGVRSIDRETGELVLTLHGDPPADLPDLEAQVEQVVQEVVKSFRFFKKARRLWERSARGDYLGGRFAVERFAARHMHQLGPGCWAADPVASGLRDYFRARLLELARQLGAETWSFPSVEHHDDLALPTGYLALHPQHVTFGFQLPPHFDTIREFAGRAKMRQLDLADPDVPLRPTGFMVCPLVCHNVYRTLRGSRIDRPRTITAEGNCYRYEGHRFACLLRQWEFCMREVVFIGSEEHAQQGKARTQELVQQLVEQLDLEAWVEVATDPFFAGEAASSRTLQAMSQAKYELRLRIGEGESISGASFNYHGHHFCEPMDIRDPEGNLLCTSCVGFGLERWVAAFVARHSDDSGRWPEEVREAAPG